MKNEDENICDIAINYSYFLSTKYTFSRRPQKNICYMCKN